MSKLDKIAEAANAVSNPLSAAKTTVESARGLMNETYGLVEDARAIAAKESAIRQKKRDEASMKPTLTKERATKIVTSREVNSAVIDYNTKTSAATAAMKAALIREKQREEEHAMYWSMSQSERAEYDRARKEQTEKIKQEQLRITREKWRKKERNETLLAVVLSVILFAGGIYGILVWLAYATDNPTLKSAIGLG